MRQKKMKGTKSLDGSLKRKSTNKKVKLFVFAVIFVSVVALLGTYGLYERNKYLEHQEYLAHMEYLRQVVETETFYEGISIDGVAMGGLTLEQAKSELLPAVNQRLNAISFTLIYETDQWVIDYQDIEARINLDEVLQQSYAVAREGSLEDRYNQINDLKVNNRNFYTSLEYSQTSLLNHIQSIAQDVYLAPIDAVITFFPDAEDKFVITPEETGLALEQKELADYLIARIDNAEYGEVLLSPTVVEPAVYSESLNKLTSRVVQFYTGFGTSTQNRIHNVVFSLSKVNGLRLNPGDVFSFNEVVGRRTLERGFRPAPIIMPDRSMRDSPGGGVCQASTMMYNVALRANLEILERRHHSFPVFYVPAGLDAAVVYGALDVKFKNNRETPVFLRSFYQDGKIYVEMYGEAFPNNGEIRVESVVVETIPAPEPKRIQDVAMEHVSTPGEEKVHVQNRQGIRTRSTMTYYENGEQVWSQVIANDFYRPIQGIIYYLPLPETEAPETPDPLNLGHEESGENSNSG